LRRALFIVVLALVLTPSASAMHWLASPNIKAEATSPAGANVDFAVAMGTTCSPAPNSLFPIGATRVRCTDDSDPSIEVDSFNVIVEDTTAPAFGPLTDVLGSTASSSTANVAFSIPVPPDVNGVSEPVVVACTPSSGSPFPIGTTPVSCTATDSRGNFSSAGFNVVVTDTGDPSISVTAPGITEATGPGGAVVNYTVNASDNSGVTPTVTCGGHEPGSNFPIGATAVTCTATDGSGNHADSGPFTVTVQDTQGPLLSLPAGITVEADSTSGKAVTYSVTALDAVAGAVSPTCAPVSGSTFPIGTTTVNCSASDGSNPPTTGSFTVTVTDSSGPILSGYGDKTVEANGPAGSVVNFSTPTAVDALDGPIGTVTCAPVSGSTFPLGTTAVNCNATDAHGNTGHATFNVAVRDTTPPTIYLPTAASIVATSVTGISSSEPAAQAYFQAVRAVDMIDAHPVVTYDVASHLAVGPNPVTFHARDAGGNESVLTTTLTVLPFGTPAPATPTPRTPPADVTNVKVTPLDGAVRIQWRAGGREVMVTRSTSATRSLSAVGDETVVYKGTASSYTDRGLTNGIEYRYVVMAVDAAGNHSAGVAAVVVPRRNLLKSPKDGARLKKAPKLLWALDSEAQYYNAQLLLNGKKILSVWPVRPAYKLKKNWKFEGRKYTLKPGVYTWFVWPGYGARSAVDYGDLMGSRTFRVVR
jgi:HYR domain